MLQRYNPRNMPLCNQHQHYVTSNNETVGSTNLTIWNCSGLIKLRFDSTLSQTPSQYPDMPLDPKSLVKREICPLSLRFTLFFYIWIFEYRIYVSNLGDNSLLFQCWFYYDFAYLSFPTLLIPSSQNYMNFSLHSSNLCSHS